MGLVFASRIACKSPRRRDWQDRAFAQRFRARIGEDERINRRLRIAEQRDDGERLVALRVI